MWLKKAEFTRVIPNDGKLYGEVKVWTVREQGPLLAWFVKGEDECLTLTKLIRRQEELDLDWYDNDLRQAFDDVTGSWFDKEEVRNGCKRSDFEREVLDFGDVAADLEQHLWDAEVDLADSAPFSPYAKPMEQTASSELPGDQLP